MARGTHRGGPPNRDPEGLLILRQGTRKALLATSQSRRADPISRHASEYQKPDGLFFSSVPRLQVLCVGGQRKPCRVRKFPHSWLRPSRAGQAIEKFGRCLVDGFGLVNTRQRIVSESAILPYFPCSPSVTRSVLIPRPAARGVLLRLRRPAGFGFQRKSLCNERRKDFLPNLPKKTRLRPWERGTLASLRARVSRGQSGQIQTGEKQWHSTKTKSL